MLRSSFSYYFIILLRFPHFYMCNSIITIINHKLKNILLHLNLFHGDKLSFLTEFIVDFCDLSFKDSVFVTESPDLCLLLSKFSSQLSDLLFVLLKNRIKMNENLVGLKISSTIKILIFLIDLQNKPKDI